MPDTERGQTLLALFTSADRAEGIAGDLTEDHADRGSIWFWRQILKTAVALWGSTLTGAPLRTLALVVVGCWLFASSILAGIAAVILFPRLVGSAASWIVLSSIWWSGTLLTGALLVGIGQARGMAACVALALLAEALLMTLGVTVLPSRILGARSAVFCSIAALAPLPLLTAAAMVRLRRTTRGNQLLEHS